MGQEAEWPGIQARECGVCMPRSGCTLASHIPLDPGRRQAGAQQARFTLCSEGSSPCTNPGPRCWWPHPINRHQPGSGVVYFHIRTAF